MIKINGQITCDTPNCKSNADVMVDIGPNIIYDIYKEGVDRLQISTASHYNLYDFYTNLPEGWTAETSKILCPDCSDKINCGKA